MKLINYLLGKFLASKRTTKWAVIGMLCIIFAIIGGCISNIKTDLEWNEYFKRWDWVYGYRFLEGPSTGLAFIGFIFSIPMLLKFIWKIIKLVVYEITFEMSKAIKDGKGRAHKRKEQKDK
jgi:hypothetical protein